MNVTQNFNWNETKRPLIIFIPNYGRGHYIHQLTKQFATKASKEEYLIIVGNDGLNQNFSDLYDLNIRYFTLHRSNSEVPRNGGFIRNYLIKRCQSENLFQKDPETELVANNGYDWIKQYTILRNTFLRPGMNQDIGKEINPMPQTPSVSYRMHWGFLCPTSILQLMKGYWEQLNKYGYEDTDLFDRLSMCHLHPFLDNELNVLHHPHGVDPSVYKEVNEMGAIFAHRDRTQCIRNKDWGEG